MKKRKKLKVILTIFGVLVLCGALLFGTVNGIVIGKSKPYILSEADCAALEDVDCIFGFGLCGLEQ